MTTAADGKAYKTLHLKAIYDEGELDESATCQKYLIVQKEGAREVSRACGVYNRTGFKVF